MRVLLFGTYDAAAHPRVAVLAEGLRARGVDVAECNAPLGLDTATRVRALRQPWLLPVLAARLAGRWAVLAGRAARVRSSGVDAVLVGYLGHLDVLLARLLFPRTRVLLDHLVSAADTARDRRAGAAAQRLLAAVDAAALRAADVVLVDTEEHLQLLPPRARRTGLVVAVGAPAAWFAARRQRPDHASDRPLRVVFFGLYTPLQGAPVVGAALAALAGDPVQATMVGRGQDLAATRAAAGPDARVTWRDWVGPEELPALVAEHDVCLGIFGTGPKARRVVPNKVFQGAAAGCAVVTSATGPQLRALGEAAVVVPPGNPAALADALRRLARDRGELARVRQRCAALADADFRAERVVAPLVDALRRQPAVATREHAR